MKVYEKMRITITDLSKMVDEAAINFGKEPLYAEGGIPGNELTGKALTGNLDAKRFTLISVS